MNSGGDRVEAPPVPVAPSSFVASEEEHDRDEQRDERDRGPVMDLRDDILTELHLERRGRHAVARPLGREERDEYGSTHRPTS